MIKSKKQMFIIISIFAIVMMLGTVSYAFFNYTRTGAANNVRVGRLSFNSEQGNAININNVFPIDSSRVNIDTDYVGSTTVHITGDTNYDGGIEYIVSAINVNNTINNKEIPLNFVVTYNNTTGNVIGTEDEDYYENRGGNTSLYKKVSDEVRSYGNMLVVGYIAPGNTGIDGTITVKAYIDKDKIAISDTYPYQEVSTINSNPSATAISACATYMEQEYSYYLESGESYQSFCSMTGTLGGRTFSEWDSDYYFWTGDYDYFIEIGIISTYLDHTSSEWVDDREVFTTDEWNSLSTNGISFQIKVEANEGIWAPKAPNAIENLPYFNENYDVKEIYFVEMDYDTMHTRYDAASIKRDITSHEEGEVLCWLETNTEDNTKYNMYIASDGETYLTTGANLFYFSSLTYPEKIVFNNVNTSRVTDMNGMFYGQHNLKEVDVRSFDTSNVVNMRGFVYHTDSVEKVYMQNLDLRKVLDMSSMFQSNNKLTEVHLEGVQTRDVTNMSNMFYSSTKVTNVNLEGLGGNNLQSIGRFVDTFNDQYKTINMKNFNFGTITDISSLFYDLQELESIDLTGANMSHVTNMNYLFQDDDNLTTVNMTDVIMPNVQTMGSMFYNDSSLTTIIVSNTWNTNNVTYSDSMFYGCTSLVGGNSTVYDANYIDKEYARIDTSGSPGYLTQNSN